MTPAVARGTVLVEIWGDFSCPFCYIAKRKFEAALAEFEQRGQVKIVWKSFQLQADLRTDLNKNAIEYTAETKRIPLLIARKALAGVADKAKTVGLNFDFGKAVMANTFDAHRLAHFAAEQGSGDVMEEKLLDAFFVAGVNIADHAALAELADQVGLPSRQTLAVLESEKYADAVRQDLAEALQIGVKGVPFFLFNHTIEVAGQKDTQAYLDALRKGYEESLADDAMDGLGEVCDLNGECG